MTTINWSHDLNQALQHAQQQGRFVLLDFFSPT
jgi:hypothetical protein